MKVKMYHQLTMIVLKSICPYRHSDDKVSLGFLGIEV